MKQARRSDYQRDYSVIAPVILDTQHKAPKVQKMLAVLKAFGAIDPEMRQEMAVDLGSSSGMFAAGLAPYFRDVLAVDIDATALAMGQVTAPANLQHILADSQRLPLPAESVDLVICNHVYEHVPDAEELFSEIHRVLRSRGVCYLGAASRLTLIEPHYRLPFLSWLPEGLADLYMRVTGRGNRYYERLRTWWGIKRLLRQFDWVDFTIEVLRNPEHYGARDLIPQGSWIERIPSWLWRAVYVLLPSYILVLSKRPPPEDHSSA